MDGAAFNKEMDMKKSLIAAIIGIVTLVAGCAPFDKWATDNEANIEKAESVVATAGKIADPYTGGLGSTIAGIVIAGFGAWTAGNRKALKIKKIADGYASVIKEIDAKEGTPKAVEQVLTDASKALITDILS